MSKQRTNPRIVYVEMKTRRAKFHLDILQDALKKWLDSPPYTVINKADFQNGRHVCRIKMRAAEEIIPMALGDFICCLRAAMDQLAWQLAHLVKRTFTRREDRAIHFPIAAIDDKTYRDLLALFPSTMTADLDAVQPYHRGNAYRDDPLWQLNELWTLDKHIAIPINASSLSVWFPMKNWQVFSRELYDGLEVNFPMGLAWQSKVGLTPKVTMEILFGEYMGTFEVSNARLGEIYNIVTNDVIPRFTRFFP